MITPRLSHGKMNDSGRKVNIRPAENEFSELMRLLLAWTDNEVNHSEQDFVGIDRKIILPKQADRTEPTVQPLPVNTQKDVFSKLWGEKPYRKCSLRLQTIYSFSNCGPVPPGPPEPLYRLINWQSAAERLWRFFLIHVSALRLRGTA